MAKRTCLELSFDTTFAVALLDRLALIPPSRLGPLTEALDRGDKLFELRNDLVLGDPGFGYPYHLDPTEQLLALLPAIFAPPSDRVPDPATGASDDNPPKAASATQAEDAA